MGMQEDLDKEQLTPVVACDMLISYCGGLLMYTIEEALKYDKLEHLSRSDCDKIIDTISGVDALVEAVTISDIPAGFIGEDDASEPLRLLCQYEETLLSGYKEDRADALRLLKQDLASLFLEIMNGVEFATEEWNQIEALAKKVQGA